MWNRSVQMCIRDSADHGLEQGVVGAAQDQGVYAGIPDLGQVLSNDQFGDLLFVRGTVVHITGLHQRHEQRAGPGCEDVYKRQTLVNALYENGGATKAEFETVLQLLNPFAPHMTEELWEKLGPRAPA